MKKMIPRIILFSVTLLLFFFPSLMEGLLKFLFPSVHEWLYPRATTLQMAGEHLLLVFLSAFISLLLGIGGGVAATRPSGRDFLPLIGDLSSLMQTFPPAAVLALAVPIVGFGFKPALIALVLYSVLPVLNNTVAGLDSVRKEVIDAARGMGMSPLQVLLTVEMPLAFPVILAGVRTSVVINVGTAALGALVGAGGLGAPIVSGLVRNNNSFVLQGALATALLALGLDSLFDLWEKVVKEKKLLT